MRFSRLTEQEARVFGFEFFIRLPAFKKEKKKKKSPEQGINSSRASQ